MTPAKKRLEIPLWAATLVGVAAGLVAGLGLVFSIAAATIVLAASIWMRSTNAAFVAGIGWLVGIAPSAVQAWNLKPSSLSEWGLLAAGAVAWAALAALVPAIRQRARWSLLAVIPLALVLMLDIRVRTERALDPVQLSSRYLPMRDGTRIAADVYLPRGAKGHSLPAIIEQTRYHRSIAYRWPASLLLDQPRADIRRFVEADYAYVFADARGSGASFGTRQQEWSPDEVEDGGQVIDWVVRQPWSTGIVGATGVSYNGTSAELLATTGRSALRAVAPRFCMIDVYADILFPGGIRHDWFPKRWGAFNAALDRNQLGAFLGGWTGLLVASVRPVDGDDGTLLQAAVAEHSANYDIADATARIVYRDDRGSNGVTLDQVSTFTRAEQIRASAIPIYLWSGWADAANQRAAITKFRTYRTPGSRLVIGAWDHGASQNTSPFNRDAKLYDQTADLLRFFDYHLKGKANGFDREPPIRYFMMGAERWRTAPDWPVAGKSTIYHLRAGRSLTRAAPGANEKPEVYDIDLTAGTGRGSRWKSAANLDRAAIAYPDRAAQDRKLLVYDSQPLATHLDVVGQPTISLHLASTAADANVWVYLEDVGPKGSVTYVTEGALRALHRKVRPSSQAAYPTLEPYRSFARVDGRAMTRGELAELTFGLLPTAYRFRAGHRIRIAIAGADKDHAPAQPRARWTVASDGMHPSRIVLPHL